jgi:hypothetical protein
VTPWLADNNRSQLTAQGSYVEADVQVGQSGSIVSYPGHLELLTNEIDGSACFRITGLTNQGKVSLIVRLEDRIKLAGLSTILYRLSVKNNLAHLKGRGRIR